EAVGGGIGKRYKAVQEARGRHRQADAGLLGEEAGRGSGVAGVALMAEADVADARCLRETSQIGDRDSDDPVDGVDVVELERVDNQMDPIGERTRLLRLGGVLYLRVRQGSNGHGLGPSWLFALIPL